MFSHDDPEVLVVGAGPVGLFAALSLARRNVRPAIIDTGIWPCTHSYALALHARSLEMLGELGLEKRLLESACLIRRIGFHDAGGKRLELTLEGEGSESCVLAVTRQDRLEELLEDALAHEGVRVGWRHEASRFHSHYDGVSVTVDEYEKETRGYIVAQSEWVVARSGQADVKYVIGADGYSSCVRRAAGLQFPQVGDPQYFAVFEFETDAALGDELRITLGDGMLDVLWPLPNGACRWSFLLPGYHDADAEKRAALLAKSILGETPTERVKDRTLLDHTAGMPELTADALRTLIERRARWFSGSIGQIHWRNIVRFERRLSTGYGRDRIWLAGDSAHLTGPVGIQSMNAGLAEASDLAGCLARLLRGGATTAELDAYNGRWQAAWRQMHGLDGSWHAGSGADSWLAPHAAALTACLPATGERLLALAARLHFEPSPRTAIA